MPVEQGGEMACCPHCADRWLPVPQIDDNLYDGRGPFHIGDIEVSEEAFNEYWGIMRLAPGAPVVPIAPPEPSAEDRIADLLLEWEELFDKGLDVPAEEICRDCPELAPLVRSRIDDLKGMAWIKKPTHEQPALPPTPVAASPGPRKAGDEPISGYVLVDFLGRGGYGEVWSVKTPDGELRAIKFVDQKSHRNQEWRGLQRIKNVQHPHVLAIDRIDYVHGKLMILSELAACSLHDHFISLRERTSVNGPAFMFLQQEALRLLRQAAEALDDMCEKQCLLHLDVKPTNLLLVNNQCKVGDFSTISRLAARSLHDTHFTNCTAPEPSANPMRRGTTTAAKSGAFTPHYAPPEALQGEISKSHDQYSLALTFCELLSGQIPFRGEFKAQIRQRARGNMSLEVIPAHFHAAVARALAPQPNNRFPSCVEFVDALFRAFAGATVEEGTLPSRSLDPGNTIECRIANDAFRQAPEPDEQDLTISVGSLSVLFSEMNAGPEYVTGTHPLHLVRNQTVIIGRQEGGGTEYLDPNFQPTQVMPGTQKRIVVNPNQGSDKLVSRGHFMLKGSPLGILFINGVPARDGGIRTPVNGTQLVAPEQRFMACGEEFLVQRGQAIKIQLPNGVNILICSN